ncbi:unnamed protein product, partial [Prunus brigantina]
PNPPPPLLLLFTGGFFEPPRSTTGAETGPKMTGWSSPSDPSQAQPPPPLEFAGNCRKTAGIFINFTELVRVIPATKSCDLGGHCGEMFKLQGRFCRNFGRKSCVLAPFETEATFSRSEPSMGVMS